MSLDTLDTLDILIPTYLPADAVSLRLQREELERNTATPHRVVASCQPGSAAANRNHCLRLCQSDIAIMLDDDIHGFYPGWEDDLTLPLRETDALMATARLLTPDRRVAQTCSRCYDLEPAEIEIRPGINSVLPTAAIAFRNMGVLFDEGFVGSGFEDGDWCFEHLARWPQARFIQSNRCRLTHLNEQKRQAENWAANLARFEAKWAGVEWVRRLRRGIEGGA